MRAVKRVIRQRAINPMQIKITSVADTDANRALKMVRRATLPDLEPIATRSLFEKSRPFMAHRSLSFGSRNLVWTRGDPTDPTLHSSPAIDLTGPFTRATERTMDTNSSERLLNIEARKQELDPESSKTCCDIPKTPMDLPIFPADVEKTPESNRNINEHQNPRDQTPKIHRGREQSTNGTGPNQHRDNSIEASNPRRLPGAAAIEPAPTLSLDDCNRHLRAPGGLQTGTSRHQSTANHRFILPRADSGVPVNQENYSHSSSRPHIPRNRFRNSQAFTITSSSTPSTASLDPDYDDEGSIVSDSVWSAVPHPSSAQVVKRQQERSQFNQDVAEIGEDSSASREIRLPRTGELGLRSLHRDQIRARARSVFMESIGSHSMASTASLDYDDEGSVASSEWSAVQNPTDAEVVKWQQEWARFDGNAGEVEQSAEDGSASRENRRPRTDEPGLQSLGRGQTRARGRSPYTASSSSCSTASTVSLNPDYDDEGSVTGSV